MRFLEQLEGRRLFASYTAANVSELISAMSAAIRSGQADTISLAAGVTFSLTSANDTTNGAVGLPRVSGGGGLTIVGNGSTIERSAASSTGAFRLLDIASNGSVTMQNLTLQGGSAAGQGGAI